MSYQLHQYDDDTIISNSHASLSTLLNKLSNCIELTAERLHYHQLILNISKTNAIFFCSSQIEETINLILNPCTKTFRSSCLSTSTQKPFT